MYMGMFMLVNVWTISIHDGFFLSFEGLVNRWWIGCFACGWRADTAADSAAARPTTPTTTSTSRATTASTSPSGTASSAPICPCPYFLPPLVLHTWAAARVTRGGSFPDHAALDPKRIGKDNK
mmetsp:Transcript_30203/g.79904  ORF Transcript_30203/g.79904 Transcript_30203/m.79904 type:complete len:123 (-) Transcript_30203:192-560(-)